MQVAGPGQTYKNETEKTLSGTGVCLFGKIGTTWCPLLTTAFHAAFVLQFWDKMTGAICAVRRPYTMNPVGGALPGRHGESYRFSAEKFHFLAGFRAAPVDFFAGFRAAPPDFSRASVQKNYTKITPSRFCNYYKTLVSDSWQLSLSPLFKRIGGWLSFVPPLVFLSVNRGFLNR